MVLNSRDVTERVEAEEELRARDARFQALLERSTDLIVLTDGTGQIEYISPGAERMFGRRIDEVEGTDGLFTIHPDDLERVGAAFATAMSEPGSRVNLTLRVRHADGSYREMEAVGQNRMDEPEVRGVVWNVRDVTERLRSEAELHEAQARFAALVSQSYDVITVNDLEGILTYVSPSAARVLGYEPAELLGTEARDLIHPADVERVEQTAADQFARGVSEPLQYRARHRDGTWLVLEAIVADLLDEPSVQGVVTNARDITARRSAEQRAAELVEVLEATNEIVIISDPAGAIVYANRSARALLNAHERQHVSALTSERSRDRLRSDIMPMVRQRGSWSGELDLVDPTGRAIPVAATLQTHRDDRGAIVRIATVAHDITDLKAAQKRLEFEATHDALTGLPNRALFREIGERALAVASRTHDPLAILFLDLDGFKLVNDSFGHDVGDALLDIVAQRLREAVRAGDVLARLGGDEFVILCERPRTEHQMFDLAARIIETVSEPFPIGDQEARVGLSIGIAFSTRRQSQRHRADPRRRRRDVPGQAGRARLRAPVRGTPHRFRRQPQLPRDLSRPRGRGGRSGAQPALGAGQQEAADLEAAVQQLAGHRVAVADAQQGDPLVRDDPQGPLRRLGRGGDRVDRRDLQRQLGAADAGEVGGQHQQVGGLGERGEAPGEVERELVLVGRVVPLGAGHHRVLEAEQHPGIDLEGQVQVDGTLAALLGVDVDLPGLAQRIALDEVPLVVHVEAVLDRVVLEVGDEARHVDHRHLIPPPGRRRIGGPAGRGGQPGRGSRVLRRAYGRPPRDASRRASRLGSARRRSDRLRRRR